MTQPIRLCVVHLPSPHDVHWRQALATAAIKAGWTFVEINTADDPLPAEGGNTLIACANADLLAAIRPTDSVILAGPSEEAVASLMAAFEIDYASALKAAARLAAHADGLAASGVPVVDPARLNADFPGLGAVTRAPGQTWQGRTAPGPLSLYDTLPARVGASAVWPLSVFTWMDGPEPGVSDLTGRRRLLQHGPYLELSAGEWAIDVRFTLTLDRAQIDLRLEWGTAADTDSAEFSISKSGVYSTTLTKVWTVPAVAELRVWLDRAMFDGGLRIEECVVRRVG